MANTKGTCIKGTKVRYILQCTVILFPVALHLPDLLSIRVPCMTYLLKTFLSVQNGSEYRMNGSEKATKRQNQRLGETRGRERVKIQTCVLERILGSKLG